ncbi:MAG TPA: hypothetical protein PK648_18065 [Verrucomicrobiales bacterium]|nr:hypothetical protein [Verrucomicrobiales bacterium]
MKICSFFLLLVVTCGLSVFTSCTTTQDDSAPGGISSDKTGMSRDSIYKWQDRTLRELAY